MQIGLIGCGQHGARAGARLGPARAVRRPARRARAQRSPRRSAARRSPTNAEVAARADLVVLCHKPAQLHAVARGVAPHARGRRVDPRRDAARRRCARPIPARPSTASSPRCPSRFARARSCRPPDAGAGTGDAASTRRCSELFAELGTLVVLDDALVDVAMGLMSCAPAYVALVAEAQIDAGVRRGIPAAQGARARRADARRHRRAAAPARLRHRRRAPRGRLARRAHRARPRRARARRPARRVQRRARRGARGGRAR